MDTAWGKRVSVTLLHERETEDNEEYYEAATMGGTPHGAVVTVEDMESKEGALRRMRAALEEMGFTGRIFVHDVTESGYSTEYEV